MEPLQTDYSGTLNPNSPEAIWAILRETSVGIKELKESQKENARRQMETARQMEETDRKMKETDRQIKEYNKRFGDFTNRFGEVVEYMVAPNLREKFRDLGFDFPKASRNSSIHDFPNNIHLEIDIMLENFDKVMLVEVKTKLTTEQVKAHIARLEKMRSYANLHGDKFSILGAVAGVVMTSDVKEYALGQGLFVVEPSGETFTITSPENNPKEW